VTFHAAQFTGGGGGEALTPTRLGSMYIHAGIRLPHVYYRYVSLPPDFLMSLSDWGVVIKCSIESECSALALDILNYNTTLLSLLLVHWERWQAIGLAEVC
jgi:hypothetical protein